MTKEELKSMNEKLGAEIKMKIRELTGVETSVNLYFDSMTISLFGNSSYKIDCGLYWNLETKKSDKAKYSIGGYGSITTTEDLSSLYVVFGEIMKNGSLADMIKSNMVSFLAAAVDAEETND